MWLLIVIERWHNWVWSNPLYLRILPFDLREKQQFCHLTLHTLSFLHSVIWGKFNYSGRHLHWHYQLFFPLMWKNGLQSGQVLKKKKLSCLIILESVACEGCQEGRKIPSNWVITKNNQLLGVVGRSSKERRELESEVTSYQCAEDQPTVWL